MLNLRGGKKTATPQKGSHRRTGVEVSGGLEPPPHLGVFLSIQAAPFHLPYGRVGVGGTFPPQIKAAILGCSVSARNPPGLSVTTIPGELSSFRRSPSVPCSRPFSIVPSSNPRSAASCRRQDWPERPSILKQLPCRTGPSHTNSCRKDT